MINDEEIRHIKLSLEKITPGNWEVWFTGANKTPAILTPAIEGIHNTLFYAIHATKADAYFIIDSLTYVPKMLAEIERLRKALQFIYEETDFNSWTGEYAKKILDEK